MSFNDALGGAIVIAGVVICAVFVWGCIGMDKRDPDWWRK